MKLWQVCCLVLASSKGLDGLGYFRKAGPKISRCRPYFVGSGIFRSRGRSSTLLYPSFPKRAVAPKVLAGWIRLDSTGLAEILLAMDFNTGLAF